jgi:SAM-dependent methyltransferase
MNPSEEQNQREPASEKAVLATTGERYLPWAEDPVMAYEHLHRYAFASRHVQGKRVLDLASGEGYGSALLARTARLTVGIDIDEKTIRHARDRYVGDNIHFIVGSALDVPLAGRFDIIVCFELIEHLGKHDQLLSEVKRLLAPGGLLMISTPNRPEYRLLEPHNPFHVKELDLEEFESLLERYFRQVRLLGQRVYGSSNLWTLPCPSSGLASGPFIDRNNQEFVVSGIDCRSPLYLLGLASDAGLPPGPASDVLVDASDSLIKEKDRIQREMRETIGSQTEALAWREEQDRQLQSTLRSQEQALAWRASQVSELNDRVRDLKDIVHRQQEQLNELERDLHTVQSGRTWKLVQRFFVLRDRLLPPLSLRRRIYDRIVGGIRL